MKADATIAEEMLALLCCPETRQALGHAPADLVASLEKRRAAGTLRNRAGVVIDFPIEAGLVRADGAVFFPMQSGIPLLVADDAVSVTEL